MPQTLNEALVNNLRDPSRPCFVFGTTPPREGTSKETAIKSCQKFLARSSVLAIDGYIVYDIQDEASRTTMERPFPFKKTLSSSWYGSVMTKFSGKACVVYKSVVEESIESFDMWLDEATSTYKHRAFNLVGAASSKTKYTGPTMQEAAQRVKQKGGCSFGCVSIPERHLSKGGEPYNMLQNGLSLKVCMQWNQLLN